MDREDIVNLFVVSPLSSTSKGVAEPSVRRPDPLLTPHLIRPGRNHIRLPADRKVQVGRRSAGMDSYRITPSCP
jgi:hypothetical protein